MRKIGVVACYDNNNYGSKLQAYATILALEKQGYECEFINYVKKHTLIEKIRFIPRFFNRYLMREKWRRISKKIKIKKYPDIQKGNEARKKAFDRFKQEFYINKISKPYVGYNALKGSSEDYDAILVGSDQLWYPAGLPTNFYNLMFVPDEKLKVAYSTSFGVSEIPFYQKKRTREYLNRIEHIAVREHSGQELIKNLTGRDVQVVLDPTLLLSADEWAEAIPVKPVLDEDYIFCYFLGTNQEHRKAVTELSKRTGLKIYDMPHIDSFVQGDLTFGAGHLYDVDPAQFVNLIRHAKYVCTDSFHCCVFSILHHKQFLAFDRYSDSLMASRNSRIANLCQIAGLENRRFKGNVYEEITAKADFENTDKRIEKVKIKSFEYINKALSD